MSKRDLIYSLLARATLNLLVNNMIVYKSTIVLGDSHVTSSHSCSEKIFFIYSGQKSVMFDEVHQVALPRIQLSNVTLRLY